MAELTPLFRQYEAIKAEYPDCILMFRLGDFYEMFGEDAEIASRVLEIVLTSRDRGGGERIPMCGVPHHAVEGYSPELMEAGYRVAVCDQVEDRVAGPRGDAPGGHPGGDARHPARGLRSRRKRTTTWSRSPGTAEGRSAILGLAAWTSPPASSGHPAGRGGGGKRPPRRAGPAGARGAASSRPPLEGDPHLTAFVDGRPRRAHPPGRALLPARVRPGTAAGALWRHLAGGFGLRGAGPPRWPPLEPPSSMRSETQKIGLSHVTGVRVHPEAGADPGPGTAGGLWS